MIDPDQSVFDVNNRAMERKLEQAKPHPDQMHLLEEQVMWNDKLRHGQEMEEDVRKLRDEDEY
jgi:hypothetical protein